MDLSPTYLGFDLPHPLMSGAGPLADDLDTVRRLEDAGAAAIVMRSVFEEQIAFEEAATFALTEAHGYSHGEAGSYFPSPDAFALGPDDYLEHIRRIKETVGVPVVASLNGVTPGGWLRYARLIEKAGADALELNVYTLATDAAEDARTVEDRTIDVVREVRRSVHIP